MAKINGTATGSGPTKENGASKVDDGVAGKGGAVADSKPKRERVELKAPKYRWISWAVMFAYLASFLEGLMNVNLDVYPPSGKTMESIYAAQLHLCSIYGFEVLMALTLGWCAMSPGWTSWELMQHHVPYMAAVTLAFVGGHAERWAKPMLVVQLTPLNEGLFIVSSLGAPDWVAKCRRAFGFSIVLALFLSESWTFLVNCAAHLAVGRAAAWKMLVDQTVWGGMYYHALLLRLYIRRWRKHRSL